MENYRRAAYRHEYTENNEKKLTRNLRDVTISVDLKNHIIV